VNFVTPANAPVIDPTIGQVNFPTRISVPDARPPPRLRPRQRALTQMRVLHVEFGPALAVETYERARHSLETVIRLDP
jgi:hypothetical protein